MFERLVNEAQDGQFVAYAVSCKRTWRQDEEYKSTTFFRSDDVPVLISLMLQAHAYICEVQAKR
ncbi:MAG TPA: hypothetical protein VGN57_18915 [Pirellulaceae bacterium]|nr:hypothetical protein [Pirellulaceae bacterium]